MSRTRLNLTIAAVSALVLLIVAIWLRTQMQITPRTTLSLNPDNLAPLSLPWPTDPVVTQSDPGNGGDLYRSALAAYPDAAPACDKFAHDPTGQPPAPIQMILDAAHKPMNGLFLQSPTDIIDYQSDHAPLTNLTELTQTMDRAALIFRRDGDMDHARQYFQAVYALGYGLCTERLTYEEFLTGMGLVDGALTGLADCAGDTTPAGQEFDRQSKAMVDFDAQRIQPIYKVLSSVDQDVIALNAGDVFAFATDCQERMFRIEAILKLGRYRFDALRQADQTAAPRYIEKQASDPDPAIAAAAAAARDLTQEQYHTIH